MSETPLTNDTTIAELLAMHPGAARILLNHRMHCVGCCIAPFETIGEACAVYGVAVEGLLADIDRAARGACAPRSSTVGPMSQTSSTS